jgi:heat shock protein HslJ
MVQKLKAIDKTTMRLLSACLLICLASCTTHKQITHYHSSNTGFAKDSVEYYETDFETRQKNYLDQLQALWKLNTMQRQARIEMEPLSGYSISLDKNMRFTVSGPCGDITGIYDVKGTGIKFNNISTEGHASACDQEQQKELIRLLGETVSAYTVSSSELLLRDNATNIIFRATR